jgi:hypothetical protein
LTIESGERQDNGFDSSLDFREFGKSTKCNVDHSKYHCILPSTSLKQKSMRLQFVKLCLEKEQREYFKQAKIEGASINGHHSWLNKTVRPLYEDSQERHKKILQDFNQIICSIKRKPDEMI